MFELIIKLVNADAAAQTWITHGQGTSLGEKPAEKVNWGRKKERERERERERKRKKGEVRNGKPT